MQGPCCHTDTLIQARWITQSQVSQLAQALQFTECQKRGQRLAVLEQLDRPGKRQGLEIKLRKGIKDIFIYQDQISICSQEVILIKLITITQSRLD